MIPSNKTIYEYLLEFAYTRSDAYLFLSEEKKYTSRKVLEYVHGIGNFFYEKGLRCGDKVALCANRSVHATILLLMNMEIYALIEVRKAWTQDIMET